MFIYKITNEADGKFYIGKTTSTVERRFKQHIKNAETGTTYLYNAMRRHGIENFKVDILEEVTKESLNDREIFWIDNLQPHYNMTAGGDGGDTSSSPNYIIGIQNRESLKGKTYEEIHGVEKAAELKALRAESTSKARKGKTWDIIFGEEKAEQMRQEASTRRSLYNTGRTHSSETKDKIAQKATGRKHSKCCCIHCQKEVSINNLTSHQKIH